jgi:hypothetical protein
VLICITCEDKFLDEFDELFDKKLAEDKEKKEEVKKEEVKTDLPVKPNGKAGSHLTTMICDRCGCYVTRIRVRGKEKFCVPCDQKIDKEKSEAQPSDETPTINKVEAEVVGDGNTFRCEWCYNEYADENALHEVQEMKVCEECKENYDSAVSTNKPEGGAEYVAPLAK